MGVQRIVRNLDIVTDDVIEWCRRIILKADVTRKGKNWYAAIDVVLITVNAQLHNNHSTLG
jgi:hypothetical protein